MRLLNERETSQLLGCSVAALRKWRLLGKGPVYVKVERLVRYSNADLETFLSSRRVLPRGVEQQNAQA